MSYKLKKDDPVLGKEGTTISNEVYDLLPKSTQEKYVPGYGRGEYKFAVMPDEDVMIQLDIEPDFEHDEDDEDF